MAGSREYGSFDYIPLRSIPLRMTVSKYGTLAVRAGVGTGPYRGAGRSLPSPLGQCRGLKVFGRLREAWLPLMRELSRSD